MWKRIKKAIARVMFEAISDELDALELRIEDVQYSVRKAQESIDDAESQAEALRSGVRYW